MSSVSAPQVLPVNERNLRMRSILHSAVVGLKDRLGHEDIPAACQLLGMPMPGEGTKREKIKASLNGIPDDQLSQVAERFLEYFAPPADVRNSLQDLLWVGTCAEIPKRHRRDIARNLEEVELFSEARAFRRLLESLWVLDDDAGAAFLSIGQSLRDRIEQHVFRNQNDWSADHLFEELGAYEASDRRFAFFMEGLASADVQPEIDQQGRIVTLINKGLLACGLELRETGTTGGYPVFKTVSIASGRAGRPKNLIFASRRKPDLRFHDAVNNDIEIMSDPNEILVYDRTIGVEGLRWADLQEWWAERQKCTEAEEAKRSLYIRLRNSLPANSPPQFLLFETYHKHFRKAIPKLPALLPEVWLHWDPKTAEQRGRDALLRFRMDFLMLLPNNARVVIEVDGKHHYADRDGNAQPALYAAMMAADRDLRFAGYDVYRFGASELRDTGAAETVVEFFRTLFKFYRIGIV